MIIDYFTISNSEITATFSIESVQRSHGHASGYAQVETWILKEGDRVIRTSYGRGIKKMEKDFQKAKDNALSKGYTVIEPNGTIKKEIKKEVKEVIDSPITETVEETKEEPIDNTVVKAVKETKPQNKIAKLQAKLTRLNAQLSVTKGNRAKVKIVLEILRVESAIKQLEPIQKSEVKEKIKQSKPVDAPVTKKDEFCKKPEKATIKFLESKFKNAQIDITDKQIILKSETSELALNRFVEIPYIDEYCNHYRREKLIKRLRDGQTSKAHSVCEYIGSILLTV